MQWWLFFLLKSMLSFTEFLKNSGCDQSLFFAVVVSYVNEDIFCWDLRLNRRKRHKILTALFYTENNINTKQKAALSWYGTFKWIHNRMIWSTPLPKTVMIAINSKHAGHKAGRTQVSHSIFKLLVWYAWLWQNMLVVS